MESYCRQGYLEVASKWLITEDQRKDIYQVRLTAKGYQAARQPGTSPLLVMVKDEAGDPR
ncbi:MAG: hypothetical protein AB1489_42055 [Acidobacteriota bacterium]